MMDHENTCKDSPKAWIYALDDAVLLLDLVVHLEAPVPERLPVGAVPGNSEQFESPMSGSEMEQALELLVHHAVHIAVLQAELVLGHLSGSAAGSPKEENSIDDAMQVCALITAAYVSDPASPVWQIACAKQHRRIEITGVLSIDTNDLHGQPVMFVDYGGIEAIKRLLHFARSQYEQRINMAST